MSFRRLLIGFGIAVPAGAAVWLLTGVRTHGQPTFAVTVSSRPLEVAQGTTAGQAAARLGLRPGAGDLLDVNGKVLRPDAFSGGFLVDGKRADGRTPLIRGDQVAVRDGRDRREPLARKVVREPGGVPTNPEFSVDRVPGEQVVVRGAISHELVSSRFHPTGSARAERAVALTFDDGPSPDYTARILVRLARLRVHATFFVIGYLAKAYPALVQREARMGMAVGNHSYNHPDVPPFDQLPQPLMRDEIALDDQVLERLGVRTRLFRPPGGGSSASVVRVAAGLGQRVVLWSVDPTDWEAGATAKEIAHRVLSAVRPGSIVIMHDGGGDRSATLGALPAIVHGIRARGLRLVTLAPGVGPVAQTSPAG